MKTFDRLCLFGILIASLATAYFAYSANQRVTGIDRSLGRSPVEMNTLRSDVSDLKGALSR